MKYLQTYIENNQQILTDLVDRIYSIKSSQMEIGGENSRENEEDNIGSSGNVISNINNMGGNKYRMQVRRLNKMRKTLRDNIPFDQKMKEYILMNSQAYRFSNLIKIQKSDSLVIIWK